MVPDSRAETDGGNVSPPDSVQGCGECTAEELSQSLLGVAGINAAFVLPWFLRKKKSGQ
jgi:hypothetical protein